MCVFVVECFMLVWSKVSEGQKFSLQLELCVWRVESCGVVPVVGSSCGGKV